jgi:hypothetical protein
MMAVVAASLCAAETNYRQQIEAERKRLNDRLHSKDSPLGLISRFGVRRGRTAIGRGPENALQLAVSSGPQHFGVAMWDGEVHLFTPARGVEMRKAGSSEKAPVTEMRFCDNIEREE